MLKYTEPPAYKTTSVSSISYLGICFVVIVMGVLVYFNR